MNMVNLGVGVSAIAILLSMDIAAADCIRSNSQIEIGRNRSAPILHRANHQGRLYQIGPLPREHRMASAMSNGRNATGPLAQVAEVASETDSLRDSASILERLEALEEFKRMMESAYLLWPGDFCPKGPEYQWDSLYKDGSGKDLRVYFYDAEDESKDFLVCQKTQ